MRTVLNLHLIILILTVFPSQQVESQQRYNDLVEAKIDLEANTEFISITGSAYNKTNINQSLRFILSVIKNDPANPFREDTEGRFVLAPGEKRNMAQTTVSARDEDRIILLMLVYNAENKLIGKDRMVINPNQADLDAEALARSLIPKKNDIAFEAADGILMRGIVIEDTKTKPGRDFFKEFSSSYIAANINGEKIITVKETLALANNTKIEVYADQEKVFEFLVRPQFDFINAMADRAVLIVNDYFLRLRESGSGNIIQRY